MAIPGTTAIVRIMVTTMTAITTMTMIATAATAKTPLETGAGH